MKRDTIPMYTEGTCDPAACVTGACYRFSVLTEHILRLEYDPAGRFEDRPSQTVLCRRHPVPDFRVRDDGQRLELDTEQYHLTYYYGKESRFTESSLIIDVKNNFSNYGGRWHFGTTTYSDPPRHHNLWGTARTLDRINGATELERGLMDLSGRSFFDDSETALFDRDGTLQPRRAGTVDVYYICCQRDYAQTLKEFFALTGRPPMIPRYALGNWWSRYYAYSEETYLELMERFRQADIPISVAVLDMDWHITKVDPKYGRGWTGHTWNRELFPQPEAFLQELHRRGLHTALNLHPADGIQAYEDAYPRMAAATGANAEAEEPVVFDMTDPVFTKAYFELLMHPLEEMGVDHWWIDWQQGRKCATVGMDPLWLLNHYHYTDNCRAGKRGLILSRYAGLGSHRYPAGFSGDTVSSWESLDFQAYFTLTAANAGFPFWSHDIGGFAGGIRDPELFIRWLQLGVFSSFLRLHATCNPFANKEPWSFAANAQPVIAQWLRLRHKLLPYLYTEMYRQHQEQELLIQPLYYRWPMENRAYRCKNQYLFGKNLMVCPITAPADPETGMGAVTAWIPQGVWTDIFTGKTYTGDRVTVLNRPVEQYPVLAAPGTILPTALWPAGSNRTGNPEALEIFVFPGASGSYTLFEDDGLTGQYREGRVFYTECTYEEPEQRFTLCTHGDAGLVSPTRRYRITFRGFEAFTPEGDKVEAWEYDAQTRSLSVTMAPMAATDRLELKLVGAQQERNGDKARRIFEFLNLARIPLSQKKAIFDMVEKGLDTGRILEELQADQTDRRLMEVLNELLND